MITGKTKIFGIIADPITHVQTPQTMNRLFAEQNIDAVLVPMHVAPDDLPQFVSALRRMQNFGGMIATIPHKPAILALCDRIEGDAQRIGAVNTVRRDPDGSMVGTMLDGRGFVAALEDEDISIAGKTACLLGAGGAAAAIAFGLAEAGLGHLTIVNRSSEAAEKLSTRLGVAYPQLTVNLTPAATRTYDLVVNATSLGLKPDDPLPLSDVDFTLEQTVFDAIMEPAETPLLRTARLAGAHTINGLPMLRHQIRLMAQHMAAI